MAVCVTVRRGGRAFALSRHVCYDALSFHSLTIERHRGVVVFGRGGVAFSRA